MLQRGCRSSAILACAPQRAHFIARRLISRRALIPYATGLNVGNVGIGSASSNVLGEGEEGGEEEERGGEEEERESKVQAGHPGQPQPKLPAARRHSQARSWGAEYGGQHSACCSQLVGAGVAARTSSPALALAARTRARACVEGRGGGGPRSALVAERVAGGHPIVAISSTVLPSCGLCWLGHAYALPLPSYMLL